MSQSFVRTASSVCQAQEENMSVNAAKSNFGKPEVEYLGHVLTKHGIKSQTKKCIFKVHWNVINKFVKPYSLVL